MWVAVLAFTLKMFMKGTRYTATGIQYHTLYYIITYYIRNYQFSRIFFGFFDGVIDIDISISRVIFHGHFFTCCLTTGRGSGVDVEWRVINSGK